MAMTLARKPATSTDRLVLIVLLLARGEHLTVDQVMQLTGLTRCSARRLLTRISFMAPIYDEDGVWRMLPARKGVGRAGEGVW